jgi:hypothetical protein
MFPPAIAPRGTTILREQRNWICYGLAALPPVYVLAKILLQGIDLPFFDEWFPYSSVDLAIWTRSGTLRLDDLIAQNFEHRIVFTRAVTVLGAWLWNANERVGMIVSWVLAVGVLAVLSSLVRRSFPGLSPLALVPLSALVFTARAQNNWLWAFENQWYFCILFFVLGLWWAGRPGSRTAAFAGAAVCAVAASFSFGAGLLAWGLLALAMATRGGWRARHWTVWTALAVGCVVLYFTNYRWWPSNDLRRFLRVEGALHLLRFVLTFLGGWAVPESAHWLWWASLCGAAALVLFAGTVISLWRAGERVAIAPWCALGVLPVGAAAMLAQGWRSNDINHALFGRYVSLSSLLPASAAVLLLAAFTRGGNFPRHARFGAAVAAVALFAAAIGTSIANWRPAMFLATRQMQRCARAFPVTRDLGCIEFALLEQDRNREKLDRLAELELSAFSDRSAVAAAQQGANAPPLALWHRELDDWERPPGMEQPTGTEGRYAVPQSAVFVEREPMRLCLADLQEITLDVALSRDVFIRLAKLFLKVDGETDFSEEHMVFVNLARDEALHRYAFSLAPLASAGARVTGMRIDPVLGGTHAGSWVEVHNLRAVRKSDGPSACAR